MALTPAVLTKINIEVQNAWLNSQAEIAAFKPKANTVLSMLANQRQGMTRNVIQELTDRTKNNVVRVLWYDWCEKAAADCSLDNNCTLTGAALNVLNKDYTIVDCIYDAFSVNEDDYMDTSLSVSEAITNGIRNSIKTILERLNDKAIAVLEAQAMTGSVLPTNTIDDIITMMMDAQTNSLEDAFGIDGGRFMAAYIKAQLGADDTNGGNARVTGLLPMDFDINGFAKNNVKDNTYLMSPYAYAILSKNYAPSETPTMQKDGETIHYKLRIPNTELFVDVTIQNTCVDKAKGLYNTVVDTRLHYLIAINPAGCENEAEETNSGILRITKTETT